MADALPIEVSDVHVSFRQKRVLDGVSLRVRPGEVVCFVGGSGSGKSTFLRTVLGLQPISGGSLRVFGVDLARAGDRERHAVASRMGMLFQHGALLGSLSALENVALPLRQLTRLPAELVTQIALLRLAQVGLTDAAELFPRELSGGMRKRVALARAVVHDPQLILCDEPSAGLDPENIEGIDRLLLRLRDELGASVLVVTHEVPSIRRIADRVVVLRSGRVVHDGTRAEVERADDPWVQRFFGAAQPSARPRKTLADVLGMGD